MFPRSSLLILAVLLIGGPITQRCEAHHEHVDHLPPSGLAVMDQAHLARELEHARHAVLLAERTGSAKAEHAALCDLARAERMAGLYAEFLGTTLRALQLAQQLEDVHALASGLQDLSLAYHLNHQPDKAVDEARNALAMVLPTHDHASISHGQRYLMGRLIDAGRSKEALDLGERALDRAREASDVLGIARIHHLIGAALMKGEAYGEGSMHLALAEPVLLERGTIEDRQQLALDQALGELGMGRTGRAKERLAEAERLIGAWDHPEHRNGLLEAQIALAKAEERWQDAANLLGRLKDSTDSLTSARVTMQMAALQVRYQLDQKEADNARLRSLNNRQNRTIAVQHADRRLHMSMLAALVLLTIGLVAVVLRNHRMVRRERRTNALVRRQSEELSAKNLELERQYRRLTEALLSEEEKEMTIKEIHHRVKNNLQVVDSLLSLQGGEQNEPSVTKLFKEAQGRIRSMAMVHEHIFRAGGMTEGTLRNHLTQLARSVITAYGMHDRVSVSVETHEPMFPVDTLMPLTLLVNELLTNAMKHAFDGREKGIIRIMVRRMGEECELVFADDGVWHEAPGDPGSESFGLQLVRVLAEQLNGSIRTGDGPGSTFVLRFREEKARLRVAS